MKRIIFAALCSSVITLGACASRPGYAPASSSTAAGYSDQMIARDRYRVHYTGTRSMSSAEVQDYALMRAAQLTLEQGGAWFEVVDANTDANARNRYSIETDFGPDYAVQRSCGLLGCTTTVVPVMTRTQRESVETRTVYEHSMEIVIGSGPKLAGSPRVYDAKDTFSTLNSRLG